MVEHAEDPTAELRWAPYDVVYVPRWASPRSISSTTSTLNSFVNPSFGVSDILNPAVAGATVTSRRPDLDFARRRHKPSAPQHQSGPGNLH